MLSTLHLYRFYMLSSLFITPLGILLTFRPPFLFLLSFLSVSLLLSSFHTESLESLLCLFIKLSDCSSVLAVRVSIICHLFMQCFLFKPRAWICWRLFMLKYVVKLGKSCLIVFVDERWLPYLTFSCPVTGTLPMFGSCQGDSLRDGWHDALLIRQLDMVNSNILTFCALKVPSWEHEAPQYVPPHDLRFASCQSTHISFLLFYVTQSLHLVLAAPNGLRPIPLPLIVCLFP